MVDPVAAMEQSSWLQMPWKSGSYLLLLLNKLTLKGNPANKIHNPLPSTEYRDSELDIIAAVEHACSLARQCRRLLQQFVLERDLLVQNDGLGFICLSA